MIGIVYLTDMHYYKQSDNLRVDRPAEAQSDKGFTGYSR
jgi:hypothetical protein